MYEFWILFKYQFKARFRLDVSRGGGSPALKRLGLWAVILLSFGSMLFFYGMLFREFTAAAYAFGQPQIAIDAIVLASFVLCFTLGIFTVLSYLYFSRDTAFLSTLPVRKKSIFLSKLAFVYLFQLAVCAYYFIPGLIIYMTQVPGTGAMFLLRGLFVLLLLPVFPLFFSSLAAGLFMSIIRLFRRRELFMTALSFIFMGLVIGGQFYLNSLLAQNADPDGIFFEGAVELIWQPFEKYIVGPISWASNGITGGGFTSLFTLISLILISAAAFALTWLISSAIYSRTAAIASETAQKSKKLKASEFSSGGRGAVAAVFVKEWRLLLRSPVYATNGLTGGVVALFLFLPMLNSGENFKAIVAAIDPVLQILAIAAAIGLFSSMNLGATTCVSREGSSFWILKSLPVSYGKIVWGKLFFGCSIPLLWALPVAAGAVIVLGVSVWAALLGFALGMILSAAATAAGMIVDFARPKLSFGSEAEAMKQNLNGLIGMAVGALLSIASGAASYFLYISPLSQVLSGVLAGGFILLLCAAALLALIRFAPKMLDGRDG